MTKQTDGTQIAPSHARVLVDTIVVRSALDVLAASAQQFEHRGIRSTSDLEIDGLAPSFLTNIGFAGEQLRGSLCVAATAHVVRLIQPDDVRADATSDDAIRDLLGELANLILGRFKYHLLKRDVTVMLATPTTMSGRDLRISATAEPADWHAVSCLHGTVFVRLEADFSACGELGEESSRAEPPMDEGATLLF